MATKNDITGDSIRSKELSEQGKLNWDIIFGKKEKRQQSLTPTSLEEYNIELSKESDGNK